MSLPAMMHYCSACDFEQGDTGSWGTREYVLDDSVRIPVDSRMGWCASCHGLAAIEDLSSKIRFHEYRKAQGQLHKLSRRWGGLYLGLSKSDRLSVRGYEDQLEDAIDSLEMLSTRHSPPRCLQCFSTQVQILGAQPDDCDEPNTPCIYSAITQPRVSDSAQQELPDKAIWLHPGCGGEIRTREHPEGLRLAPRPTIHRYTSEGIFIETEYVSGYSVPDDEYWEVLSETNGKLRALRFHSMDKSHLLDIPKFLRKCAD